MVLEKREGELPLSDITVIDLTQVVAGPFATMNLGDLGAEVIKIEAVGRGDRCRNIQPVPEYFDTINRNKQSIAVNLKTSEGQEVIYNLVETADVFIESTKPGRVESFNIAYDDLIEYNSELIYCSISGFGSDSPYENLPAWDMLIQGMSGIMSMTGEKGGQPVWSGLMSGDLITSMYTTQSVLAALYAREKGRIESEWIEVPMLDAAVSWLCSRAGYAFGYDEPFPRLGTRHPSIAPFGIFTCRDDSIVIAAGTDSLFEDFCSVLEREDLFVDERFADMDARVENVQELTTIIESELESETAETWVERLQRKSVPAGLIHDTKTIWEDEHIKRRELYQQMEREDRKNAEVIDHPIHFTRLATQLDTAPEPLGESTTDVLRECGYEEEELRRYEEEGIIG